MTAPRRQSADPLERYDTPAWITRALIVHGPVTGGRVIEPCAGAGAMATVLRDEAGCDVAAFDIEPRADGIGQVDTLTPGVLEQIALKGFTDAAIITNPPFSLAASYFRRGMLFRRIALLVRITWLEATKDRESVGNPVRLIVLPRPRFVGQGSDSATVVWACWGDWKPGIVRLSRADIKPLMAPTTGIVARVTATASQFGRTADVGDGWTVAYVGRERTARE